MKTVPVVEDSDSGRDVTSHFLQQGGSRTLETTDSADVLNALKQRHIDLALTGIRMPNIMAKATMKLVANWKLSLTWPETEQNPGIDIGYSCDAFALLNRNLETFERKW